MKKKILIIEDDRDTSDILQIVAGEMDLNVISSATVLPVSKIEAIKPDLILLDHWIGDKLGGDLCSEIKDNSDINNIPIVLLSAHSSIPQIAKDSCADAYIEKPFELEDLEKVIKQFLDR